MSEAAHVDSQAPRRAPRRGRYDRDASPEQRRTEQHRRLLDATATVMAHAGARATATAVVRAARVGRNTFYEHFTNLDSAIAEVSRLAIADMENEIRDALVDALTPIERIRALAHAWITTVDARPELARALLRRHGESESTDLSYAGALFRKLLDGVIAEARRASAITPLADERRVVVMSAVAETLAREHLRSAAEDAELLADLLVRAFR